MSTKRVPRPNAALAAGVVADVGVVRSAGSRKQTNKAEGLRDCAASLHFKSRTTQRAALLFP
jgi:hypothetical protein